MIFKYQVWVLKRAVERMKRERYKLENRLEFLEDRISKFDPIVQDAVEYLKKNR
jgi:hypothetical protein